MRAQPLLGMIVALALQVAPDFGQQRPLLLWNASPSVPVGLYWVGHAPPRVGDLVVLRLPRAVAALADRRGYLPRSVYLVKPVVAVGGDRVCRFGARVFIRRFVAVARATDAAGRPLPTWQGCRTLRAGQVFLVADHPASFDSRYFGLLPQEQVVGRASLMWSQRQPNTATPP